jgi:putative transposase
MPLKAYRFRIYPNKTQQKKLAQFFGAKRFAWNACLSWRSDAYKTFSESVTGVDFSRELTWLKKLDSYHWLKDVPATVLTQGILDQDNAFRRYFKEGAGYPKYKARHDEQKIRFQMDQRIVTNLFRAGEFLKLTGLGEIKVRWT